MSVRIGTSGWVYAHWRGIFYPKNLLQADWFGFYARHFDTVEVNSSFYRLPTTDTFRKWREQAPRGFIYAIKASRFITHLKKLKDVEQPTQVFLERSAFLGETLGPILFQLPPHWGVNLSRLEAFLQLLPEGHRYVFEFRDASWLIEDVFQLLEGYHVSHCIHDMAPLKVPLRATASPVYVRFHGDVQHGGRYPAATLRIWAKRIEDWRREGYEVYAYFNNDYGGYALQNAETLRRLLR